ncbi:MAG: type II secretion system protein [Planctomycetota bacterium]
MDHHQPLKHPDRARFAGFTLIELLVSIAIIAVLIGILLPVLPRVRDAARKVACGSNMKQVAAGITLYQGEFRDVFPVARYMPDPWLSGDDNDPLPETLSNFLEPVSSVWKCPGDREFVYGFTREGQDGQPAVCNSSYWYVSGLSGQRTEETFFVRFLKMSPSETPVISDFDGGDLALDENYERYENETVTVGFFHSQRNMLFADMSVGRYADVENARDGG